MFEYFISRKNDINLTNAYPLSDEEGINKLVRTKINVTATPSKEPLALSNLKTFGGSGNDYFNSVTVS